VSGTVIQMMRGDLDGRNRIMLTSESDGLTSALLLLWIMNSVNHLNELIEALRFHDAA